MPSLCEKCHTYIVSSFIIRKVIQVEFGCVLNRVLLTPVNSGDWLLVTTWFRLVDSGCRGVGTSTGHWRSPHQCATQNTALDSSALGGTHTLDFQLDSLSRLLCAVQCWGCSFCGSLLRCLCEDRTPSFYFTPRHSSNCLPEEETQWCRMGTAMLPRSKHKPHLVSCKCSDFQGQ